MLKFNASWFMHLLHLFDNSDDLARANWGESIPDDLRNSLCVTPADELRKACDKLSLPVSSASTGYIHGARTGKELSDGFRLVKRTIHSELQGRIFFEPDQRYKQYLEQPKLFGDEVFVSFHSANDDIFEAGMCLALGTAYRVCNASYERG